MTLIKTTYDRRSFLKVSTAAGGGLVLGFNWLAACTPAGEMPRTMPEEWFNVNAYLKIGDNGIVTIYSPNPEIGQGVKTSMPMVVAEELDVNWKDVIVEQAGLSASYKNQFAGGSLSIYRSWDALRMAGGSARAMLMNAAAAEWQVDVKELTTEGGVIKHNSGKSAGYGVFASKASTMEVPEEIELKEPKDFKLVGQPTKNVDGNDIITGQQVYGMDINEDGMLIAMLIHPPAFGMQPKSVDGSAAKAMPGIVDVISISTRPKDIKEEDIDPSAFTELVVIVGESTWQVIKAKDAVVIEWEKVSSLESTQDHNLKMNDLLAKATEKPLRKDGDPEKAFKNAAKVLERTYSAPVMAHNAMEPLNFYANVKDGKAELRGPIQTPESLSRAVSQVLGIDQKDITVDILRAGGGFGRRLYGNFGVEAAVISSKVKAPVKLVYKREDDMTQGTYRPAYKVTYRAAIDENNNVTGFHIRGVGFRTTAAYANRFPAGTLDNFMSESHRMDSNISTGAWRAPRSHFVAGAEASFLDELAEELGKDPIDLSLELFERSINDPVGEENDYDPKRYAGVIKLVREKANWGEERPGIYRGFAAYFCHNSYAAEIVDIKLVDDRPVVDKVWCAADCGIVVNPEGAKNQLEGGIVDGIGHAMYSAMTFTDGVPDQNNFDSYRLIRNDEAPFDIESFFVENDIAPTGLGEPGLPPAAGALANALYKATGKRYYHQPFSLSRRELGVRVRS
jgi:isoquinoline 1-oxidoreductase beta subunit